MAATYILPCHFTLLGAFLSKKTYSTTTVRKAQEKAKLNGDVSKRGASPGLLACSAPHPPSAHIFGLLGYFSAQNILRSCVHPPTSLTSLIHRTSLCFCKQFTLADHVYFMFKPHVCPPSFFSEPWASSGNCWLTTITRYYNVIVQTTMPVTNLNHQKDF